MKGEGDKSIYSIFRSGIQLARWRGDKIIDPPSRLEPVYQAIGFQFFRRPGGYSGRTNTNCDTRDQHFRWTIDRHDR